MTRVEPATELLSQLLFREARLLDQGHLEAWLALFTDDCVYWVTCSDADPDHGLSIIYDDRSRLEERVERVGRSPSQSPRSTTCHIVSNVEILIDGAASAVVNSNLVLFELRHGVLQTLPARCEHHLVAVDAVEWRIARKKVVLLQRSEPLGNLSFLL